MTLGIVTRLDRDQELRAMILRMVRNGMLWTSFGGYPRWPFAPRFRIDK